MWEKLKGWFKHSLTILAARVLSFLGVLFAIGAHLAADPTISGAVQSVLKPEYVPYYIIAAGIIVELARRRTAR